MSVDDEKLMPWTKLTGKAERITLLRNITSVLYFYFFNTLLIPSGKFGPPYLGKAAAAATAALPSPTSACWVFSCFRQNLT